MTRMSLIRFRSRLTQFIFFGNIFYGLCAVALSAEAMLQQRLPLNGFWYFFCVFIATILYYTYPYVRKCGYVSSNLRTNWYTRNYNLIWLMQYSITIALLAVSVIFLSIYGPWLSQMQGSQWLMALSFPFAAALYYGTRFVNLRRIGWLKPFMIGFIWAGVVTIYPVLYFDLAHSRIYTFSWVGTLLFLKNMMFIAVLCIMFDIKDYADDSNHQLKTFVVRFGLRTTIFVVIIPLVVIGLLSLIAFTTSRHLGTVPILFNLVPFIVLLIIAWSMQKPHTLFYYLVVIDGLILLKALCGITGMQFVK